MWLFMARRLLDMLPVVSCVTVLDVAHHGFVGRRTCFR